MDGELYRILLDIRRNTLLQAKEMLTSEDACLLMGISVRQLRDLYMSGEIPYYQRKPKATVYFKRSELVRFMEQGRHDSRADMGAEANTYELLTKNHFTL